jgi:hypothetical protein
MPEPVTRFRRPALRLLLRATDGRRPHNDLLVFLAIHLELHFVLVQRELDGSVGRQDAAIGGFWLADQVLGSGSPHRVLLTEEGRGFLLVVRLRSAIDRVLRSDCACRCFLSG